MQYPILKEAKNALDELSADPDARARAERRADEIKLWEYGVAEVREEARKEGKAEGRAEGKAEGHAEGKAEGRAEGKAEGRAKGKAELLMRLLAVKFGEVPPAVATRVAQANDEELLRWSERLLTADSLGAVFAS
jgi:flagellar biosynthesis/type III secretory pathway protein FliH